MMASEAFEYGRDLVGLFTVMGSFGGRGLLQVPELTKQERLADSPVEKAKSPN